jgi:hypothetical protein
MVRKPTLSPKDGEKDGAPHVYNRAERLGHPHDSCLGHPPGGARSPLRRKPSLRVQRRMEKIEKLPPHQQNYLLKTIDGFLKGVAG